ncbi:MAG: DNA polymerase III subunit gamma/tau [Patescibacteria group bacterium]
MSFYRIYRPKVLDEIDNAAVRQTIELLLTKSKEELPHAYLLTGPKGTGKTTTARVIAKLFNCDKPEKNSLPNQVTGAPCGSCGQCQAIADGRHLDVMEIDAASNTGVDNIRDLRDRVALAPAQAKWKIYIIDEVHMLSTGAFNALLKTLEEPPAHAIFILATTDPQKIPSTIISRCQHIAFGKARKEDLIHALARIVAQEKMDIEDDALACIANHADGSFRDAVKNLEQISFQKGTVTVEIVQKTLGISEDNRRDSFLTNVLKHDAKAALIDIQAIVGQGIDVKSFLIDCLTQLEQRLITQVTTQKTNASTSQLRSLIGRLTQAYTELRSSPIPELPLELAVVEYCQDSVMGDTPNITRPETVTHEPSLLKASSVSPATSHTTPKAIDDNQPKTSLGLVTLEQLIEHWKDVIDELKPYNHSVAAICRSTRPKTVDDGIVTIEAFYPFHKEKLSEVKTREMIALVLKKLFGEKVRVEVVLGKK